MNLTIKKVTSIALTVMLAITLTNCTATKNANNKQKGALEN